MVQTALVAQLQSISCSWPWVSPSSKPLPQQQKKKMKQQENLSSRPRRQRVDLRKLLDRTTGDSADSTVAVPGSGRVWLPQPPFVKKPRAVHNAASLAYLGDVIYEVHAFIQSLLLLFLLSLIIYNRIWAQEWSLEGVWA
jgi:hypothetical protein